jgi:hypothetical protein
MSVRPLSVPLVFLGFFFEYGATTFGNDYVRFAASFVFVPVHAICAAMNSCHGF